jgi:hypothetical protein
MTRFALSTKAPRIDTTSMNLPFIEALRGNTRTGGRIAHRSDIAID